MTRTDATRPVGRPREFDEEAVLDAAMDAFWRKGYEATSLSELCSCTGLHKGSLYQAFGDKHQLFMQSLSHYARQEFRETVAVMTADSPLENIKAVVHKICDDAGNEKGCLIINSMVELAPHDPEVRSELQRFGEQRLAVMTDMIAAAQEAGEIRPGLDPYKLARQLMVSLAGSAAMVKGFLDNEQIVDNLDELIASWT